MRIKKLTIKNNYKRFHNLTIDLGDNPKRIVALVGPNGCGKSSVFDACLYKMQEQVGQIGNKGGKDHSYHSMYGTPFNDSPIEIEFTEGDISQIIQNKRADNSAKTIISFRSPYRYNSRVKVNQTKATVDIRNNIEGASFSSDIDNRMEDNYRRLQALYNRYMEEKDVKPSEAKQAIIGDLNSSLQNCLNLKIDSLGNIEDNKGTIYFRKQDQSQPFEFNVLSSGEKEVVDIIIDLYIRRDAYQDTIFLIDEPELHINTAIQKKLLIEINKLISENCQIWLSTHSIGFLRALQFELNDECSVIEFSGDANYASAPYVLEPMKAGFQNWRRLFATALDDLSKLLSPDKIVYCEGRDTPKENGEERGFDAKVYNTIFGEKYPNTLFVSSGGNTELDQRSAIAFKILNKVFIDFSINILKDRDAGSGKPMSIDDRYDYLKNNSTNHRMLNRYEIENYLFDKEVIQAYCIDKGHTFDEIAYDTHFTDIINDDVKSKVGIIKNICGITSSVNFEKFKLNLSEYLTEGMLVYKELENCIFS